MIYEVENPNLRTLLNSFYYRPTQIDFPISFLKTATARAATLLIFNYLKNIGIIKDTNSLITVPKWLCLTYIQLLRKHCSPILTYTPSTRAAVIFHQYGFPQNMDEIMDFGDRKKITIIEDCANSYKGYYRGQRLGTFGLASVFSFPKLFPSIGGGGLATANEELYDFAAVESKRIHSRWISLLYNAQLYKAIIKRPKSSNFWTYMVYGCTEYAQKMNIISLKIVSKEIRNKALETRRKNYLFVLEYFKNTDFFSSLERDGVFPYVIPLITDEKKLKKMTNSLLENNIHTGIYHFDVNRNLFNPNYEKCIWVPIHQGLNTNKMAKICETISSVQ